MSLPAEAHRKQLATLRRTAAAEVAPDGAQGRPMVGRPPHFAQTWWSAQGRRSRTSTLQSRCRAAPAGRDRPDALALEQPLLLLHLAVHAGAGLQNLTLLRLVELHFVIRRDSGEQLAVVARIPGNGRANRSLGFAWPALKLCEDLAPGTVPQAVLGKAARHVPPAVLRVVERLTPATAQRVDRASIAEHFMWADGAGGRARQAAFGSRADALVARSATPLPETHVAVAARQVQPLTDKAGTIGVATASLPAGRR